VLDELDGIRGKFAMVGTQSQIRERRKANQRKRDFGPLAD
jgi:hypothetical protein